MINPKELLLMREREIIRLISLIKDLTLPYIIVGGYAVATIMKRFSVDLDIVIKKENEEEFKKILEKEGYKQSYSKEISTIYWENFIRLEKKINNLSICIDFMINGLVSRSTDASWSFDYVNKNSEIRNIENIQFIVPTKELLIAMKLHSGRISDTKDIVALSKNTYVKTILAHVLRGKTEKLKSNAKISLNYVKSKNFKDSFQGIFGIKAYNKELIKNTEEMLDAIIATE